MPLDGIYPALKVKEVLKCAYAVGVSDGLLDVIMHVIILNYLLKYSIAKLTNHETKVAIFYC
jgi:hypothetical protein